MTDHPTPPALTAALFLAAQQGHLPELCHALAQGADPLAVDHHQMSALHWAAHHGHFFCAAHLLAVSNPNQPSFNGITPLISAVIADHADCVALLLPYSNANQADDFGRTALHWAADSGNRALVTLLLRYSDPKQLDTLGRSALYRAANNGHTDCVALLLPFSNPAQSTRDGFTAFTAAQASCYFECAQRIESFVLIQNELAALEQHTPAAAHSPFSNQPHFL